MNLHDKIKSNKLHGHENVNAVGIWDEGYVSYREKSAEAIVRRCSRHRRKVLIGFAEPYEVKVNKSYRR